MDFADATLVVLAKTEGVGEILSLDFDFAVYRTRRGEALLDVLRS